MHCALGQIGIGFEKFDNYLFFKLNNFRLEYTNSILIYKFLFFHPSIIEAQKALSPI